MKKITTVTFLFLSVFLFSKYASLHADVYSHTFDRKTWDAFGEQDLSGVSWKAQGEVGKYFGYDKKKGQQFGSKADPEMELTLSTSGITGTIASVKVSTSGYSGIQANVSVSVGGVAFDPASQSLTTKNAEYAFSGSAAGEIKIFWKQTVGKGLCVKKIEVEYAASGATATVAPLFSPKGGTYTTPQSVSLTSATENAKIYYTLNGDEPSSASTPYTGAIKVNATTNIKAIAYDSSNANPSAVVSQDYVIVSLKGEGTKEKPFSVADVKLANNSLGDEPKWVQGYILGVPYEGADGNLTAVDLEAPFDSNTALILADDPAEKDLKKMIPVQLPVGDLRSKLNLKENPTLVGRQLAVKGVLTGYFGDTPGIKEAKEYVLMPLTSLPELVATAAVWTADGKIYFEAQAGDLLEIYNAAGQQLALIRAAEGLNVLELDACGLLLVKINNRMQKLVL